MRILVRTGFTLAQCFLLACGGGGGGGKSDVVVDPDAIELSADQPVKVIFWYQHSREREQELQKMIADFNETNGYGITVKGEYSGNYGDIYNKMMTGLQGGALPNLLVAYQNQALLYHEAGGLVDLNHYIGSSRWGLTEEERADYIASFMAQDRAADGAQIGFPPNRSLEIMYYNADWLAELGERESPRTWPEFARLCRLARDRPFSRSESKQRSLGFIYDWDASRLATMVFSRGGDLIQEGRYRFDSPQARQALELMQALIKEGAAELMSETYGDQREFVVGSSLFMIRSTSGLPFVRSAIEEEGGLSFDWQVAPPPYVGDQPVMNVYGASISVCRATPEQELASWLFLKWFTAPTQQARWVRASNYFPARHSMAAELEAYFEEYPRYRKVFEMLPFGRSEPTMAGYQVVRRNVEQVVVAIAQGADIDQELKKLDKEANATLGGH